MTNSVIGALRVTLGIDTAAFSDGLKKSEARASASSKAIGKSFDMAKSAAVGFLGVLSVGAVASFAKGALEAVGGLGELAAQAGVTTKTFQEMSYAATQAGVTQKELESGLARLTRTLGDAKNGSTSAIAAFNALGISQKQLQNLNTDEVLQLVATSLGKIPDPARRAAIEVDLFGKAGQRLDPLLSGANGTLGEFARQAQNLGVVLSDEQIQNADVTADKLGALQRAFELKVAGEIADRANAIGKLANNLARLAGILLDNPGMVGFLSGAAIGGRFGGLPGAAIGAGIGGAMGSASYEPSSAELIAKLKASDAQITPFGKQARREKLSKQIQAALDREAASAATFGGRTASGVATATGGGSGGGGSPTRYAKSSAAPKAANDIYGGNSASQVRMGALESVADVLGEDGGLSADMQSLLDTSIDIDRVLGEAFSGVSVSGLAVELPKINDQFLQLEETSMRFTENLAAGLADAIIYGGSIGDVLKRSIQQAAAELLQSSLLKLLGGSSGKGGLLGSVFKAFGGGFAKGGVMPSNKVSMVGENGPELVVPSGMGNRVHANHELAGMLGKGVGRGGVSINAPVTVYGAMDDRTARQTGKQIAAGMQAQAMNARRQGIAA